jgi:thiol:disulfide interchange protein
MIKTAVSSLTYIDDGRWLSGADLCGTFDNAPQPVVLTEFCLAPGSVVEGMFECWSLIKHPIYMRWLSILLLLVALPVHAATTKAKLVLPVENAAPGQTLLVGVHLKMAPGWHTYWRNAGDAGSPTEIKWTLPQGVTAGPIQWPIPETAKLGDLFTLGYHDEVVLLVPLSVAANAGGSVDLKAEVSWLECEVQCVPGDAELAAKLTIAPNPKPSADASLIESWKAKLPKSGSDIPAKAQWLDGPGGEKRAILIEWTPRDAKAGADFFPYETKGYAVSASTEFLPAEGGKVRLKKFVEKFEGDWPKEVAGLLIEKPDANSVQGYETKLAIASQQPVIGSGTAQSLWAMLGLAFLGGLILNVMPCVLPVIALKILGFVQQSKEAPGRVRTLGVFYTLGVLVSFLAMALLIIAVQKAGQAASWGMQFQNPVFVVTMTVLVTLVALNLFGVFEVTLAGRAMGAAGDLAAKEGTSGAFFNGVLATVLATPCTAPILAVALGFAFAQPPLIIAIMFLTMGLGLAAPYLVLSWFPQWLRILPKPGAWMEKFKIAMGFPMIAVAIWLLTITESHFGSAGPFWLGIFLVVLALAFWIWGEFVQRGTKRRGVATVAALLLLVMGYVYALEKELHWRNPPEIVAKGTEQQPGGIAWQPWSPEAIAEARNAGRPVFVDFTARWCATCKLNKKSSIEIDSVRQKLKEINAVTLIGDHTKKDPRITAELRRYQRAGVPLNLVYPKDASAEPILLPTLLTPSTVLEALEKASRDTQISAVAK